MITIKKLTLLTMLLFSMNAAFAQQKIKLKADTRIDTLAMWVNFPNDFNEESKLRFETLLDQAIERGNRKFSFYTTADPIETAYAITIDMDTIAYVGGKDNRNASLGNLLFFGAHATMIGTLGWTLPVLILFYPETSSVVQISASEEMTVADGFIEDEISAMGYFASRKTQEKRFEKAFETSVYRLLKRVNRQHKRNIKRQA